MKRMLPAVAAATALIPTSNALAVDISAVRHHQVHRQLVERYEGLTGDRRAGWTNHRLRAAIREYRAAQRAKRSYARVAVPSHLEAIAACESGGNPAAIGGGGAYRGKYQFDYGTWASVGGSGDPAAASEAEQDYRAALLYQRAGSTPWPVCGG